MDNVSVEYTVPQERIGTFKEYTIRLLEGKVKHRVFKALNDVSLSVKQGEVFGLIRQNGAGKSTLLKLSARVLRPTHGRVLVSGHVAPLLEVGAGFHPELTGRENVILYGAMLGFSNKEMKEKLPRIIEFSELGDFIDAPIRTFSSGMYARLGFAVATDSQPDILIVDEILSVGDEAIDRYLGRRHDEETMHLIEERQRESQPQDSQESIKISQVKILNHQNVEQYIFHTSDSMKIQIEYQAQRTFSSLEVGIAIHRQDGVHITGPNTAFADLEIKVDPGPGGVLYTIPSL